MTRLSGRALSKIYGRSRVVDAVDFDLQPGEIRALIGENGAGKSTLIKMISGAVVPSSGTVDLDGVRLPSGDPAGVRRRGVSVVYQEFTLVPELTAAENIFLGRELGFPLLHRNAMRLAARRIFDELDVAIDADALIADLNVGHRQMVEVARAVLADSKLLILDEPSTTLSATEVERLFRVVRRLASREIAVIYVSHRLDEILALADTVTVLRDGQLVATEPVAHCNRARLIKLMVGRELAEEFPPRTHAVGPAVMEVRNLSAIPRFRDVGFDVHRGEIVGVAGLVGSGRTSLGLALAGAIRSVGNVSIAGTEVHFPSPAAALQRGVAYVTEDRKSSGIFALLGTDENIAMAQLSALSTRGWLFGAAWRQPVDRLARQFDLRTDLKQPAGTLSGGNQQKALVGRYVLASPGVLVLDEPTRGVDVGARVEIYKMINNLAAQGMGILLISSDLEEVLGMSDRILVMREGRLAGELPRHLATAESVMALATLAA